MFLVGAVGLWGSLVYFVIHYLSAAREEARTARNTRREVAE
jgi:hypothetical protein